MVVIKRLTEIVFSDYPSSYFVGMCIIVLVLFKGVLQVYPGFDFTYVSSYYANSYNPSNMVFYVQNEKELDDQIYVDFFVSFKIKRARVFVMV